MNWEQYVEQTGELVNWPYPVRYDVVNEVDTDVLVLGGGPAGLMAAISAARKGLKVALVDKSNPKRGGGHGFDHWLSTPNPCSKIGPEESVLWEPASYVYWNAISGYITAREAYDTLLEIEKMGAKIRDTDDEFKGAPFRDEKTKFLFCYDYENKFYFRVWGTTFKPAMYQECRKLGVQIYDYAMVTSLLNEGGKPGARVVGATAFNVRTGEFYVFKAKATVHCLSRHSSQWGFSSELTGLNQHRANVTGDGTVMSWRAGAVLTNLEKSLPGGPPGYSYPSYGTGGYMNTWYPATIVDANGKEVPWVDYKGRVLKTVEERTRPSPGQKFLGERSTDSPREPVRDRQYVSPRLIHDLQERIMKGEYTLPLYADLTDMPWYERKVIWGLMVGQEGKTKIPVVYTYEKAGFDSSKDMLQSYQGAGGGDRYSNFRGDSMPYFGVMVVDWDLKTTLDGLYCAGDAVFATNDWHTAATTGRYAGRKAAEYALKAAAPRTIRKQIDGEKARVYAPVKRESGIDWKELRAVGARMLQTYCGGMKNEPLMKIGLKWAKDIEKNVFPEVSASNPHILMRVMESYDMITCGELIIQASLGRKASSRYLGFFRQDYTSMDPAEWEKWLTIQQVNGDVKRGELPLHFWGSLKKNYETHNKDYKGYYKK